MKSIHPAYHAKTTITCACGASFPVGSTRDDLHVDVCSACHPFYTGKKKLLDTAGRVDKFRARVETSKKLQEAIAIKNANKKVEPEVEAVSEETTEAK